MATSQFKAQREFVRHAPTDKAVAAVIDAPAEAGGKLSPGAVAAAAQSATGKSQRNPERFVTVLQRLLNIDGYAVVSLINGTEQGTARAAVLRDGTTMTHPQEVSTARRRDVVDALRRGTVPHSGLDLFAVGLGRFAGALDEDLTTVARGGSAFHAIRGEYGSGKTFFARWLAERAKRSGLATSEVQISETETPLHRLETVYRRLIERLTTATHQPGALRPVIVAQQLLALCLQEHRIGDRLWQEWWNGLGPFASSAEPIVRHLVDEGYLDQDGGMLFIGPEAERRFGHRHFMNLTAVFTAPPEFTVLSGRTEIGRTDPDLLTEEVQGPRKLLLAGRSWLVTYIDWTRKRCFVEPADGGGKAKWSGGGFSRVASFELTRAMRDVLLGADPDVSFTKRAAVALAEAREDRLEYVHPGGTLVTRRGEGDVRWWTWAGYRTNATLAASLSPLTAPAQRVSDQWIRLREDVTPQQWRQTVPNSTGRLCLPEVSERAVKGLKFGEALPPRLAGATLAARLADDAGARVVLAEAVRFVSEIH